MGGQTSCIRRAKDEKKGNRPNEDRPNQYEEIDNNFTVVVNDTNTNNPENSDVIRRNAPVTYENVTVENTPNDSEQAASQKRLTIEIQRPENGSGGSDSPKQTMTVSPNHLDQNQAYQNVILSKTTNEIQDTRKETHQNPSEVTSDQSKSSVQKATPHKKSPVLVPVKKGKKKEKEKEIPHNVYAQVVKPKKKDGEKGKQILKIKEPQAAPSKGQQLNYIEVEFTSPPASKKSGDSDSKKSEPVSVKSEPVTKQCESATNYTDVILDGGRMVLVDK